MQKDDKTSGVKGIYPDEADAFMKERPEGSYTLLDVRQPMEYEEAHLPGARLIPLPKLFDSIGDLDPGKAVLVYCAVGGRSRMAAQLLANQGFKDVTNILGGIQAWEQPTASGPTEFHLRFIRGDENPEEVIGLAYGMELALREFHRRMRDQTSDGTLSELLAHLIKAEDSHMKTLENLLRDVSPGSPGGVIPSKGEGEAGSGVMEGGIDVTKFMEENELYLRTLAGYLEIAMMIETQALDLYLRMAGESKNEQTRKVLLRIGDEEKAHLSLLGKYMDEKGRHVLHAPL
jgi:sulfur-carrier protein adenylyltransferase/sulfurtransferase